MLNLGKMAFDLVSQLIWGVIQNSLKLSTLDFFEKRKIERRVEDATAEIVQGLLPFLEQEKIPKDQQLRLIETCVTELRPFAEKPTELFKGSLDGQKIFDNLYHQKNLPEVIIEDGLKDIYSLLFPRIATLLCKIPAAVKDWENEAWSENYRRFDEVVGQLKTLFAQVDELASMPNKGADRSLTLFKRTLTQKIGLQLDITGLRADQPLSGKFDDFFVLPEIKQSLGTTEVESKPLSISDPSDCFCTFTTPGCLAIVIGAPGAGKSTWSKWLQRETLKSDWSGIGVRVEFRDLKVDNLPSIYDLVRKAAGKQLAEDLTSERIRKWLDDRQIALILDGFDEVKPTERNKFVEWIREISEVAKECAITITSRPLTSNHLEKLEENWQTWEISPFDEERIITYISKWYANAPLLTDSNREIDAEDLAQSWLHDPTLGPLTSNPLLLSTLLMVHHLDGKLPNGRANLYKRYVDGMLGIWDDRHKLEATDIHISPTEKRKVIQGIALHLFLAQKETIDENLLCEWLDSFLPKINISVSSVDVLEVLRERSGLIIGPGVYSFAHKTIAEFLVAEAVLQGDQQDKSGNRIDRFRLFEYRNDDRWNTVLFLWTGMAPFIDMKAFIDECIRERNWSLVFGLFDDQYEKFSQAARKDILDNLKNISNNYSWKTTNYGVRLHSKTHDLILIPIPDIELRGLTDYRSLERLIFRAIQNQDISWHDFSTARGKAYGALWFAFVHETGDIKEWLKITKKHPDTIRLGSWKRYQAHLIYSKYLKYSFSPEKARNFRLAYLQRYPDYEGYLSYSLLEVIGDLLSPPEEDEMAVAKKKHLPEKLNEAINILLEENIEKILQFFAENHKETGSQRLYARRISAKELVDVLTNLISKLNSADINNKEIAIQRLKEIRKGLRTVSK